MRKELQQLGFNPPPFRDERDAPAVDRELLRSLLWRELPESTARLVYRMVYSFRSWHEAYTEVVIDEYRRQHRATEP